MNKIGYSLSTGRLSWENLRRKPFRSACLIIVVSILAFTLFGGSILVSSLQNGLTSMTKRFGADMMVVPAGNASKAEAVLLRGEPNFFYFDESLVTRIAQTEGITQVSAQCFLTSLSTECCDDLVQLIAFDPATDFVIQPWIAEVRSAAIADGQLVVGSRIEINSDGSIKLFNRNYPVAAQLSRTAAGFDTSIFMTRNTMDLLIDAAHKEGYAFIADREPKGSISAILARVDSKADAESIARSIKRNNQNVDVLVSQGILAGITGALQGLVVYINSFSIILWVVAVVILTAVFSGSVNERKKEFAVLRILGATRRKLALIVLSESALAGLAGSLAGIAAAGLVVFPFSTYIGLRLGLPYIQPGFGGVLGLILFSLVLSFAAGPLAAVYSAMRIGGAEAYFTMREGE
ncbi:MAG: FtsX-like permease family protein [Spirochaetales bacterium]|jgi:putative ABC transport system permease protein|nr:FtsX-like permease family protein [Spirochaetales bacterium]